MAQRAIYHDAVKAALTKEGWTITHDPYPLRYGEHRLYVDLGASAPIGAEKEGRKIAVEIKSFLGRSEITDLERALGQYRLYRFLLRRTEEERTLFITGGDPTMDRTEQYRRIIKRVISEYAAFDPSTHAVEAETVFDDERGHYELVYLGWENRRRVHGTVLHVDIRDGKIWIQHDGTQDGIADELLAAGVPHEHIVLGFHHPDKRKHTPFAVA